jgi:hypothetical protein
MARQDIQEMTTAPLPHAMMAATTRHGIGTEIIVGMTGATETETETETETV